MEKKYFLLGDIHGDFKPVRDLYQRHPFTFNKTDNTLILLGDAGLNFFFNHRDKEIKKKLGKYPFTYFVVRGNHEDRVKTMTTARGRQAHRPSILTTVRTGAAT